MDLEVELELDLSDMAEAQRVLSDGLCLSVENTCQSIADDARATHSFQNQSTNLEQSIGGQLLFCTELESEGHVYALEEYASFVEEGTDRMEARPFLGPAVERGERELRTQINWAYRECQAALNHRR